MLDEYREGMYGEVGSDDAVRHRDLRVAKYADTLAAVAAEIARVQSVETEREALRTTLAELLNATIDAEDDSSTGEETPRGSAEWLDELRREALRALTPTGKRDNTPELSDHAQRELAQLATDFSVVVVLTANEGGHPRLIDAEGNEMGAEWLAGQNPARYPNLRVGFSPDPSRLVSSASPF